ncbi:glycoside hydrolase family 88 protein [Paenibacillus allorhizosphaerae]|uniref:Glucuronyl hydrolase n=1 Tax=Paenibacillus allorhizosphaerae TaxID=2849866 RepID=A0ABM8VIY4_9BACL|nr:glycoside hydrolase family 88 protein [Paenibacillus allorhizosphaerae]CAG7644826.1 hypothetical protein PAECIP111802_03359 [Paenibacillus allorhizosphaerae]
MDSRRYVPARIVHSQDGALPEGKRLPRGWSGVRVGKELRLAWPDGGISVKRPLPAVSRLRISAALDYRAARQVEAFLPESGRILGYFDIRYAYAFQPFELMLTAEQTEAVLREGVGLRADDGDGVDEGSPLWIFDELNGDASRQFSAPHLYIDAQPEHSKSEHFLERMASLASLQPFGWLEGCVLDGLYDLRAVLGTELVDSVIARHLGQFVSADGELRYEDLQGRAVSGSFTTIEATLPVGIIAKLHHDHPAVIRALAFWDSRGMAAGGSVIDGDTVSAEGAYTVAYPMAAVAARLRRQDLAERAIRQLLLRRDRLVEGDHIHLRYSEKKGTQSFRSWARAYAWYMLGMTRTWIELKASGYAGLTGMAEIEAELGRVARAALAWRRPEGLWACFLDEPDTGIDTSGSAGIAAALALGAKHGVLPQACFSEAEASLSALESYLTPDGILSGVAQHNAGGLELQRSGYRVLSQMGMGLMAQLYAAVHTE